MADLATHGEVNAGHYEGVGFEFNSGGIVGVDFDHCIQGGKLDAWAAAWVERFNSYTEVSPSGTGLHTFAAASCPARRSRSRAGKCMTVPGTSPLQASLGTARQSPCGTRRRL